MDKKISFDFDATLAEEPIQEFAKELIDKGYTVVITTARRKVHPKYDDVNDDIYQVAEKLGITEINFTNLKDKVEFFSKSNDYLVHLDDNKWEVQFIEDEHSCRTKAIRWVDNQSWKQEMLDYIEKNS